MKIPLRRILPAAVVLFAAAVLIAPARAEAKRLLVNKAEDHDDGECTESDCTLREAIRIANDDGADDKIEFDLPAPHRIILSSLLPPLTEDGTLIDGTTDPDYRDSPVVVLEGDRSVPITVGLEIRASRCTVRGLSMIHFFTRRVDLAAAVYISGGEDNLVEDNYLGIAPEGTLASERNGSGVWLASSGQTVRNNVISHNGMGIFVAEGIGNQTIEGNRIGTDPTGLKPEPNNNGVWLARESFAVRVGGPGRGNLISGNDEVGIVALGHDHVIRSNLIGTDVTGDAALPNYFGIIMDGPSDGNRVGGSGPGEGNVISASLDAGILIGDGAHIIQGNKIGTNASGTRAMGNLDGIVLTDFYSLTEGVSYKSHGVVVGGVMGSGAENIISGNTFSGVSILTSDHVIQGNLIGTDASGTAAIPNSTGVGISGAGQNNRIGGVDPGLGNLISGNERGVVLYKDGNQVVGNLIGTNRGGDAALGNGIGVQVFGSRNSVGTGAAGAGNVVSGNEVGVSIEQGAGNRVLGNRIGTSADGSAAVPNRVGLGLGLDYDVDPTDTIIGAPGAGNSIEYNAECGVFVFNGVHGAQFVENTIAHNSASGLGWCTGQGIVLAERGLEVSRITLSRNSFFRNAGMGIQFYGTAVNGSIEPPMLTRASLSRVEGTACPGCKVEIFKADVDPTGFGEGKTFLAETTAGADGSFSVALSGVYVCDVLTATATDAEGNTSEFSRNYDSIMCFRLPPISVLLGIPALAAAGGLAGFVLFLSRRRTRIFTAIAGGLLGGGLGVLVLVLPFVRVNPPAGPSASAAEQAPFAPCSQYLDVSRMSPADGTVFAVGTDVRIEVYSVPMEPAVQTRWRLEVTGPTGSTAEKEFTGDISILLSELGMDPSVPGTYTWKVSGERLDPQTQQWLPLCRDRAGRAFHLRRGRTGAAETHAAAGQTQSAGGTTPAAESSSPIATLKNDANCRKGPGTGYSVVTMLPRGGTYPIDGRNAEGGWWWVRLPGQLGHCWVAGQNVEGSGDTGGIPVVEAPPLGCWIKPNPQAPEECVAPCPQGADSSKVCGP
jgi:CSLREA domain-containing protein